MSDRSVLFHVCFSMRDTVYLFDARKRLIGWRPYDRTRDTWIRPMSFETGRG